MRTHMIYNRLRAAGLTEAGALGVLGNWECESNCEPCRVQGDFSADRHVSREYAAAVDGGSYGDNRFAEDAKGWGLAQWTYHTRKRKLLLYCRERGASIADEAAQVDFALEELREDYPSLLALLNNSGDLYQCVSAVCTQYERPAVNNISDRYAAAQRIQSTLDRPDTGTQPVEDGAEESYETFWPPRMLCQGMEGTDVTVLQALLLAHGYNPGSLSGVFDSGTRSAVCKFQKKNDLDADGVAGPMTWGKLTEIAH